MNWREAQHGGILKVLVPQFLAIWNARAKPPRELPPPEPFAPEEAEYFRRRNALEAAGDQEGVRVLDAYWDTHGKLPDKLK